MWFNMVNRGSRGKVCLLFSWLAIKLSSLSHAKLPVKFIIIKKIKQHAQTLQFISIHWSGACHRCCRCQVLHHLRNGWRKLQVKNIHQNSTCMEHSLWTPCPHHQKHMKPLLLLLRHKSLKLILFISTKYYSFT